ncbi:MAG: hypothetical protein GC199_09675 [Alphaproteobacteria bacterium]|nr:hypothetical protein [Alphaproteobacteria bacterium]
MAIRAWLTVVFLVISAQAADAAITYQIRHERWLPEHEEEFSQFVQAIGESNCETTVECFQSSSNPYRDTDPRGLRIDGDCADLPYQLRAYFAWKKGLPFSYAAAVSPLAKGGDIRFNRSGNKPVARQNLYTGANVVGILNGIVNQISSATFRVAHTYDRGASVSDFYSPKIEKGAIRAGTVIYDINGHVVMVFKVTEDGRVHYMDSHPDRTLTRSVFGAQFARDDPALGSGFKNWRPIELVGASKGADGVLRGGKLVFASNEQIADFSTEQYVGNAPDASGNWKDGKFINDGVEVSYFEFVRLRLADGNQVYNPVYELSASMRSICGDLEDRVQAVDMAIGAGIHRKDQPSRLPDNIYGTAMMEWEIYSTPSRDARLKTRFAELYVNMKHLLDMYVKRDPRLSYDGVTLKEELIETFNRENERCRIVYRNTDGQPVTMTFKEIMQQRLFKLSFDPYHCIERRWGATDEDELESCDDGGSKRRWYEAEQRLRNQIDRTYDKRMDFDLGQLRDAAPGSGQDSTPNVDVESLIQNLGPRVQFDGMKPVGL